MNFIKVPSLNYMNARFVQVCIFLSFFTCAGVRAQSVSIDAGAVVSNHADQVGIWVNHHLDTYGPNMRDALKNLKVKVIRWGLGFKYFDKDNLSDMEQRPADGDYEWFGYNFGPGEVADLCDSLGARGMWPIPVGPINYAADPLPHDDQYWWSLGETGRASFVIQRARDFVNWNKARGAPNRYLEIGNEDNFGGHAPWSKLGDPVMYAKYALEIAKAVREADPAMEVGINGTVAAPATEWFERIYAAQPTINNYIDFFVGHVYCFWMTYENFRDNPDWDCSGMEVVDHLEKHFPQGHVHITEFGTLLGNDQHHWRAVSLVNTIRHIFKSPKVRSAVFWPSKWEEMGAFGSSGYTLTTFGKALACYTRFAYPRMTAQGKAGNLRYMALRDTVSNALSIYLINGGDTQRNVTVTISNFAAAETNERWELFEPQNRPEALHTTTLSNGAAVTLSGTGGTRSFTVQMRPVSVTVVSFAGSTTAIRPLQTSLLSSTASVTPVSFVRGWDIRGRHIPAGWSGRIEATGIRLVIAASAAGKPQLVRLLYVPREAQSLGP